MAAGQLGPWTAQPVVDNLARRAPDILARRYHYTNECLSRELSS